MKLTDLSTGDAVYRYEKSIVICFNGKRKVLSTSVHNGGVREDLKTIFNHDSNIGAGMACKMLAPTLEEHMKILAQNIGLEPAVTTGMGTAANMENVAIHSISYKELTVTAIVTGGIEVNGGRVGDPADYFKPMEKPEKPGTINIILVIDADLPHGTMARALVTCTEAKTAAIQELMAGSNYSQGLATGSGTDQTLIVSNSESNLYLDGAGKHSKLGELIGKTVIKAVKDALNQQTRLNPQTQHDVLKRLKRFGINEQTIWEQYKTKVDVPIFKPIFLEHLSTISTDKALLTYTSLYVHLLDQLSWTLLAPDEVLLAGNTLLEQMANLEKIQGFGLLKQGEKKESLATIENLLLLMVIKRAHGEMKSQKPVKETK